MKNYHFKCDWELNKRMTEEEEYDKIVEQNKQNQPEKCNGCQYEATNGTRPCMPRNRICDNCPY